MKKALKVLAALVVVLTLSGFIAYNVMSRPAQRPASTEKVEITPERVKRGEYLTKHVAVCFACHSEHDWTRYAGPITGPPGAGGDCLTREQGAPGPICAPNITPDRETGIGDWTDGEILRAMREGVDRKGRTLFPMMPYEEYRKMSDEDAKAIVAYLRSMPPVRFDAPRTDLDFPIRFFMKGVPKPLDGPVAEVDRNDPVKYGKYLTDISVCMFCHSPVDAQHQPIQDKLFAGGHPLLGQWGVVRSANLTFHPTGLGNRSKEEFIAVFRSFSDPSKAPVVKKNEGTGMPWYDLAGMSDEDLGAIYDYLRSLPPQDNVVEKHPKEPLGPKKSG